MLRVEIFKCDLFSYWYADKIGQQFDVNEDNWRVIGTTKYIKPEDAFIVSDIPALEIIKNRGSQDAAKLSHLINKHYLAKEELPRFAKLLLEIVMGKDGFEVAETWKKIATDKRVAKDIQEFFAND